MERRRLYFKKGAHGFWPCSLEGAARFFDHAGEMPRSALGPAFPKQTKLD